MTIAIVTASIAPYTDRLYNAFAQSSGEDLRVFACEEKMAWRAWELPTPKHYSLTTLKGFRRARKYGSGLYFNPGIVAELVRLKPEIVIVAGHFSPTMLLAAAYARTTGTTFGISTDGTLDTDPGERSRLHASVRKLVIPWADFGIGASEASVRLLQRWGLAAGRCVVAPIVSAWDAPAQVPDYDQRPFDVLYSGFIDDETKGALFLADVLARCGERGAALKVRVIGDGPLRGKMQARLQASSISVQFDGYLQQHQLAQAYASAKLLAFPTRGDVWGLVANEAALCGTPVLASPHAASSQELVARYGTGVVVPLDVEIWSSALANIVSSPATWRSFLKRRDEAIASFSLERSVAAMERAITLGREARSRRRGLART